MSVFQAVMHATASQVTIAHVRQLVELVGPEAPTIDYKADMSQTIAKAVAALANTYGGLVLVGITMIRQASL